jgi:hypothetical protein
VEQVPTQEPQEMKYIVYRSAATAGRAKTLMNVYGWVCVAEHPIPVRPRWWQRVLGRSSTSRVRVVYRRPYDAQPYTLFQSPPSGASSARP